MEKHIKNQEISKKRKNFKLVKNKRWISAVIATSLVVGSGIKLHQIRKENDERNQNLEYAVGYDGINLFTNWMTKRVGDNNFVLLNIKDHDSISILMKQIEMKYCVNNKIDMGLIIDTDSNTLGDIYLDFEYLLSIMEKYKITYPVYLNVDSIIKNEKIRYDDAIEYIELFLEKASLNNIYIGVMGSKKHLEGKFNEYSKLFIDEQNKSSEVIFKDDAAYYADSSLKKCISDNYLNDSLLFKEDYAYLCDGSKTLSDIAYQFNISVEDLKKFNDIEEGIINDGTVIRIPSKVQGYSQNIDFSERDFYKGIDISHYQGEINWDVVDCDYAIIQVRDFIKSANDSQFLNNVIGCSKNNIPMGFYVFSRATSIDGIIEEARYVVEQLRNVDVTYPVYLDLETKFWSFESNSNGKCINGLTVEETKNFVMQVLKNWELEINKAGYIPGIYCGETLYSILNEVSDGYINKMAVWTAGGKYYNQEIDFNNDETLPVVSMSDSVGMKQISQKGKLIGITDIYPCHVDINYCYVNYAKDMSYDFDRINFSEYNHDIDFNDNLIPIGIGVGSGIILEKMNHRRKVRKRRKNR